MLGWEIFIHRQVPGVPHYRLDKDSLVASWVASLGGLDWLDELARKGKATDHGGNGYPMRFTAPARHILPRIASGPPAGWLGDVRIDRAKIAQCTPDEELYIEAWDQS